MTTVVLTILVQFRDYPLYIWHVFDFRRQIIVCSMSSIFYTIDELWLLCIDTLVLRFDNHVKMWDVWQDSHLIHGEITVRFPYTNGYSKDNEN